MFICFSINGKWYTIKVLLDVKVNGSKSMDSLTYLINKKITFMYEHISHGLNAKSSCSPSRV